MNKSSWSLSILLMGATALAAPRTKPFSFGVQADCKAILTWEDGKKQSNHAFGTIVLKPGEVKVFKRIGGPDRQTELYKIALAEVETIDRGKSTNRPGHRYVLTLDRYTADQTPGDQERFHVEGTKSQAVTFDVLENGQIERSVWQPEDSQSRRSREIIGHSLPDQLELHYKVHEEAGFVQHTDRVYKFDEESLFEGAPGLEVSDIVSDETLDDFSEESQKTPAVALDLPEVEIHVTADLTFVPDGGHAVTGDKTLN